MKLSTGKWRAVIVVLFAGFAQVLPTAEAGFGGIGRSVSGAGRSIQRSVGGGASSINRQVRRVETSANRTVSRTNSSVGRLASPVRLNRTSQAPLRLLSSFKTTPAKLPGNRMFESGKRNLFGTSAGRNAKAPGKFQQKMIIGGSTGAASGAYSGSFAGPAGTAAGAVGGAVIGVGSVVVSNHAEKKWTGSGMQNWNKPGRW